MKKRPQVSLVIKDALAQGRIKAKDPNNTSTKYSEYIPFLELILLNFK
jgi:hypothetical protein